MTLSPKLLRTAAAGIILTAAVVTLACGSDTTAQSAPDAAITAAPISTSVATTGYPQSSDRP
ncbi:MAG: hypothetical protein ACR2M1_11605 [Gemmatimonadaceae bacterium]